MKRSIIKYSLYLVLISLFFLVYACNYATYRSLPGDDKAEVEDPEPDYSITLNDRYQDFVTYIFMGNRNENFSTYFNKFFTSQEEYDEGMTEYRTLIIANYSRRLDSLYSLPALTTGVKEKLNGVIVKCSKIIQYNKSSRFLDASVLLIGKSYYYLQDYFQSERKFSEFLSKLNKSKLTDEALLYLGKTKLRLKNEEEGFSILNDLIEKSAEADIKSEATQELALYSISVKDNKRAIEYIQKSTELTNDKNSKAEKQFLLGRLLESSDFKKSGEVYSEVIKNSSDFDLTFFANLNYGKVLNLEGKYSQAYELLSELSYKYRDYPDFRQLADFELANNLHFQKKFRESLEKYFTVIIEYPNTKASSESYFQLGKHYEHVEKDYLKALVNYKKVNEQNAANDYADFSTKRVNNFERYFELMAIINDTTKGTIPSENSDLEKFRLIYEEEKGIKKEQIKGKDEGKDPKGGGFREIFNPMDTTEEKSKDTSEILKKPEDDSLKLILEKQKEDSLKIIQQNREDSIKAADVKLKEENKFSAFLELSEIFTYELNLPDSAEYYINNALIFTSNTDNQTKANYFLASLYKNTGRTEEANIIFNKIIETNPNSVFANESRKILNLPVIETKNEEAETDYKSAEQKIVTSQYQEALRILENITTNYSSSEYAQKSLYTIGWLYENILSNKDSMVYYYQKLQKEFPQSVYAQSVSDKITFYTTPEKRDSVATVPDSLAIEKDTTGISNDTLNLRKEIDSLNQQEVLDPSSGEEIMIRDTTSNMPKKK